MSQPITVHAADAPVKRGSPAKLLLAFTGLVIAVYPLLVYWGLTRTDMRILGLGLLALALLRLFLARRAALRGLIPAVGALAVICLLALLLEEPRWFLFYPFAVNFTLLGSFLLTLHRPPSMIERFARISEPDLPAAAVGYCARVTLVWCLFFAGNGALALLTALKGDPGLWALYNGLISYGLMGLLFAVEYAIRRRLKRRIQTD